MLSCSISRRSSHFASSGPRSSDSPCSARPRKYSACNLLISSASPLLSSLSRAYSWMVSSITKRGSSSAPSSCLSRLLSRSEETPSKMSSSLSASHMASMASRAHPPENTATRAKSVFSRVEQLVAPLDRAPECPLPLGQVSRSADEKLQTVTQSIEHRPGREQLYARRGELYRQR